MSLNIPVETKPFLWGLVGGAIALAVAGFSWGGWVTSGKVESIASQRANEAVVAALAPVCVESFKGAPDAAANLTALKKVDSWSQGEFVEKGGWVKIPGANAPDRVSAVAKACASLLAPT
jgi:alpha/beta superfamily hydrolase